MCHKVPEPLPSCKLQEESDTALMHHVRAMLAFKRAENLLGAGSVKKLAFRIHLAVCGDNQCTVCLTALTVTCRASPKLLAVIPRGWHKAMKCISGWGVLLKILLKNHWV